MLKLYSFHWEYGRMGDVYGLFIAEEADVEKAMGQSIYFGEILGKHSDVLADLEDGDLTIMSDNQELISELQKIFGKNTLSGYNPLEYISDDDE